MKKNSFKPLNYKIPPSLHFKGEGAKYIGFSEPEWPCAEEQLKWSNDEKDNRLLAAFKWYSATQKDADGQTLALNTLNLNNQHNDLIKLIKNSNLNLSNPAVWLIRMAHMGRILTFKDKKTIAKSIRTCQKNQKESSSIEKTKPNVQDFLHAKLKKIYGEIDYTFDQFMLSGYKKSDRTVMNILADPELSAPTNRMKDIVEYCMGYLNEYKAASSGKDPELSEGYSHLSAREMKAAINWWENAIGEISHYQAEKKSIRKPRSKKVVPPAKIVAKLKYMKECPDLKLTSIDPVQILKSSEMWIFDVKKRKIGHFVALGNSTFDVQGNKILNIDPAKSKQKILRKPLESIPEFMKLTPSKANKWFSEIKAVEIPLQNSLGHDIIILKVGK